MNLPRIIHPYFSIAIALICALTFQIPDAAAADKRVSYRTITWDNLMPANWDPMQGFSVKNLDRINDADPRAQELMLELRALWDNAPTRKEFDGAAVRLPGYVVPLDQSSGGIKEFLLVPYFGACIHTPPPPANQIVHVVLKTPRNLRTMDAVWLSGTMKTKRQDSPWGMSAYSMDGMIVEPYKEPRR